VTAWVAPTPAGPVSGTVTVPGSKSATARGYVLAALAEGPSVLSGVLDARDTRLMRAALTGLGVGFEEVRPGTVRIVPPAAFRPGRVDVGLAGTIMRFVPPIAALADGPTPFTGDPEAEARPVFPLLDGLAQVGVRVEHPEALPFVVHGAGRVAGGHAAIDASASSQFVSGLLLSAARFDAGLALAHTGVTLPSLPHIALTEAMLSDRGVAVTRVDRPRPTWRVEPGPIGARDEAVEPDLVNAATFFAAAAVTGGEVTVPWPRHTAQAAEAILGVFEALGATVTRGPGNVTVRGGRLSGADLDLSEASELTCVVAALLALADSPGRIRGVGHVRHHETDRLAALESELTARGGRVRQTADGLVVEPAPLHGGVFRTYADHRMAHAAAVVGLAVRGIELDDVGCTTKTIADFPERWGALVAA